MKPFPAHNVISMGISESDGKLPLAIGQHGDQLYYIASVANCSDAINNHDTLYIYSDNRGRTWKNNAGSTVADMAAKTSAGIASPGLVVDPLPVGRDMMNQETQITDHHNLIHVVVSYIPDPYQPGCATDRKQAQPFHLWRAADGTWTKTQVKLGGQDVDQGYDRSKIFVDDRDPLFTKAFEAILAERGVKCVKIPARSPNCNPHTKRFVQTTKYECLNHLVLFGERHLRHVIKEFMAHYHRKRFHQGLGGQLIEKQATSTSPSGALRCRSRLGEMLNYYYREAA